MKIQAKKLLPGHAVVLGRPDDPAAAVIRTHSDEYGVSVKFDAFDLCLLFDPDQLVTLHETSHGLRYDDACGCPACEAYCNQIDEGE